jgi:hypothetical protein
MIIRPALALTPTPALLLLVVIIVIVIVVVVVTITPLPSSSSHRPDLLVRIPPHHHPGRSQLHFGPVPIPPRCRSAARYPSRREKGRIIARKTPRAAPRASSSDVMDSRAKRSREAQRRGFRQPRRRAFWALRHDERIITRDGLVGQTGAGIRRAGLDRGLWEGLVHACFPAAATAAGVVVALLVEGGAGFGVGGVTPRRRSHGCRGRVVVDDHARRFLHGRDDDGAGGGGCVFGVAGLFAKNGRPGISLDVSIAYQRGQACLARLFGARGFPALDLIIVDGRDATGNEREAETTMIPSPPPEAVKQDS